MELLYIAALLVILYLLPSAPSACIEDEPPALVVERRLIEVDGTDNNYEDIQRCIKEVGSKNVYGIIMVYNNTLDERVKTQCEELGINSIVIKINKQVETCFMNAKTFINGFGGSLNNEDRESIVCNVRKLNLNIAASTIGATVYNKEMGD